MNQIHSHHRKPKKSHPWRSIKNIFTTKKDKILDLKLMFSVGKVNMAIKNI